MLVLGTWVSFAIGTPLWLQRRSRSPADLTFGGSGVSTEGHLGLRHLATAPPRCFPDSGLGSWEPRTRPRLASVELEVPPHSFRQTFIDGYVELVE